MYAIFINGKRQFSHNPFSQLETAWTLMAVLNAIEYTEEYIKLKPGYEIRKIEVSNEDQKKENPS